MAIEAPPLRDAIAVIPGEEYGQVTSPSKSMKWPTFLIGRAWLDHINTIQTRLDDAPEIRAQVSLTAQAASIPTTPVPLATIPPGVYRVSYSFQITRVGSVSSSLALTIGWTSRGQALTRVGAAEAGNLITTYQFGTIYIRSDDNSPITYATTYADGGGAVSMQYSLDLVAVQLAADA